MNPTSKQKGPYRHPALEGLSEEEFASVFGVGTIKKFAAGDVLITEGPYERTIFLIIDGSLRMLQDVEGGAREVGVLRRGDYFGELLITDAEAQPTVVVAAAPVTVLTLNESGLRTLSPKIQISLYSRLAHLAGHRLYHAFRSEADLRKSQAHYTSRIRALLSQRNDQYAGSTVIKNILKAIPRLPVYASRLPTLLLDESTTPRDVAELAKLDPSLVGVVLKTVNSAYYSFRSKISDFNHAVLLLGFNQVYQLVMDLAIRNTMPKTEEFRLLQFRSIMLSFIGFEICLPRDPQRAALVSTIGLLRDMGRSVILLLKSQHPPMALLIDLLDHAKIGSLLLKEWNIPEIVCRSVEYQAYPEHLPPDEAPEEVRHNIAALYLAQVAFDYMQGVAEKDLPGSFYREYANLLNITEPTVRSLVKNLLLPALQKKQSSFPLDVQLFVSRANDLVK